MGAPITARLDDQTVAAVDRAVAAGAAPTRSAVVVEAVREWLARHSEDAIAQSYRHAYAEPDPDHDALVARLGEFTAATIGSGEPGR